MPCDTFTFGQHGGAEKCVTRELAKPDRCFFTFTIQTDQFDFSVRKLPAKVAGGADLNGAAATSRHQILQKFQPGNIVFDAGNSSPRAGTAIRIDVNKSIQVLQFSNICSECFNPICRIVDLGIPQRSQTCCRIDINGGHIALSCQRKCIAANPATQIPDRTCKSGCFVARNSFSGGLFQSLAIEPHLASPSELDEPSFSQLVK